MGMGGVFEGPVMGVDVNGGKFSYAILINGDVVDRGVVDERGLLKLIKKYRVGTLAVDNIRELIDNAPLVLKKMGKLPHTVHVVQVTMVEPGREVPMEKLVTEYLGHTVTKLDPDSTAEYLARLCNMGIGSLVKLYEAETRIVIKASQSSSQGGMSRPRFERNVAHRIRQLVKEIKAALERAGIDYDLFYAKDSEGIRSAVFVAYSDKAVVRSLVKPVRSIDVKVTLESIPSQTIRFVGLSGESTEQLPKSSPRHVIVGVDPGMVVGLAIMDLRGNVLYVGSGRSLSRRAILKLIYQYGTPIVVAVDVSKPPEYAKKLASMVNAVLYYPERDMAVIEKSSIALSIAEKHGLIIKDTHQRDALAAAHKAFLALKPKLDRVEEELRRLMVEVIDEAKAMVVRGLSISQVMDEVRRRALGLAQGKGATVVIREVKPSEGRDRAEDECQRQLTVLTNEVKKLREMYEEANRKVNELLNNYDAQARRDQLVRALYTRLSSLETELERCRLRINELRALLDSLSDYLSQLVKGEVLVAIRVGEEDDLPRGNYVPILDPGSLAKLANTLLAKGISTVLLSQGIDEGTLRNYWKRGLRVVPLTELKPLDLAKVALVSRMDLEAALKRYSSSLLSTVDEDLLERVINEYRRSRALPR